MTHNLHGRLAIALAIALSAAPALAAPAKPTKPANAQTLDQMEVLARTTEYDGKAHTYTVKGDVAITLKDLAVSCDQATIYASPKEDQVERIVFSGKVEAKRSTGTFRGEKVTYYVAQRKLVAEGGTRTRLMLPASGSAAPKIGG
ncbi:Lipopolysaccharide export system protein LptA [compost metagenome]